MLTRACLRSPPACGTVPIDERARLPASRTLARHEMSDSKTPTRLTKVLHRTAPPEAGTVKPAPTVPKNADRIHDRHAAITDNFKNWRSYKEWAEKIRGPCQEKT